MSNRCLTALYDYEWHKAEEGRGKAYHPLSHLERWVPITFIVLYRPSLRSSVCWTGRDERLYRIRRRRSRARLARSGGWSVRSTARDIAPGEPAAERSDYGEVVLEQRLRDALARLNPDCPPRPWRAFRKLTRPEGAELVARNRACTGCWWMA